ncbi:MAG: gluconokinase [Cyclobacteriaceae bacterium]|nr:gluconokinase [Cyclobacteriaceae bacterium]
MSLVLALDIGTGSAKALAVDQRARVFYSANTTYETSFPKPDYAEQNPDEIASAVHGLIQQCPESIKSQIAAISFSAAMHSIMPVDTTGKPLMPLMIWSDLRSRQQARRLKQEDSQRQLHRHTGTAIHPMSPLCKLAWLKEMKPDLLQSAYKFIGIKEYIWHKLFGVFEIDQGLASATGLMHTGTKQWFAPALDVTGIEASKLSAIVSVYHSRSLSSANADWRTGYLEDVRVVIGSSDGCLANLGSGAITPDKLSVTIGTSGAVRRTIIGKEYSWADHGLFCYHLDEDHLIEGGASNNGTAVLNWYLNHMLEGRESIETFIRKAMETGIGADGLLFLPYVLGERSPFYNPDAFGAFLGIRHHHDQRHFRRAVLEGIAYMMNLIAEKIETCSGPFTSIIASGGFTHSREWVQMLADISGKTVTVQSHEDASAMGAAILGFKALNMTFTGGVSGTEIFQPDPVRYQYYRKAFTLFKDYAFRFNEYY